MLVFSEETAAATAIKFGVNMRVGLELIICEKLFEIRRLALINVLSILYF